MGREKRTWSLASQTLILLSLVVAGASACPYLCTCAEFKVNCYSKGLTEIPDTFPPGVVSIDLQYNDIDAVGADHFRNLTSLTEVMLRFNRISGLEDGAFSDLPSLQHLNLASNRIANLSGGAFRNVPSMRVLDLTDNELTGVDGAFQGLASLTKLVLTRNALEALTEDSLQPLSGLIYFMADENRIATVHPAAFRGLTELSFLSLIGNPLGSAMDGVLSQNAMLSHLNLDDCRLTNVPAGLPWATRNLQLRRNNITAISSDTFRATQYLGVLALEDNQIARLAPDAFAPVAHIQEVWLNGNRLTSLPTPIPPTLRVLSLDDNAIATVGHDDFPHDGQLTVLSLAGNGISSVAPFTFSRLAALEKLHLARNNLTALRDRSFFGMRNLTLLEVGRNPIAHIEVRFAASLHSLRVLDLSYVNHDDDPQQPLLLRGNFFRDIPFLTALLLRGSPSLARSILASNATLASFYHLQELDLRDNGLRGFQADLPRFFPSLEKAWLAGNAWACNPGLLWLHDWIKTDRHVFQDLEHLTCASPAHLAGSVIADLPYHAFFYTTTTTTTTTTTVPTTTTTTADDDVVASGDVDGYETDSGRMTTTDSLFANVTTGVEGSSLTSGPAKSRTTVRAITPDGRKEKEADGASTTKDMGKYGTHSTVTEKTKLRDTTTSNIKMTTTSLNNNDNNNSGAKTSRVKGQTTITTSKLTTTTSTTTTTTSKLDKTTKTSTATTSTKPPPKKTTRKTTRGKTTTTKGPQLTTKTLPPSSTSTPTTTTPAPTDIPRHGESKIGTSSSSSSTPSTTTIIIAAVVAGVALIVIVVVALTLLLRHKRHIRLVMYRTLTSDGQAGDTTELVLHDHDDPDSTIDAGHVTQLSESEQGSTPSVEVASDDGLCTRLV